MVKSIFVVFVVLALVCIGSARWVPDHQFSPESSATIANAIKTKL